MGYTLIDSVTQAMALQHSFLLLYTPIHWFANDVHSFQADHLQKQASLTLRLHNIEKQYTENYEKQRNVQRKYTTTLSFLSDNFLV